MWGSYVRMISPPQGWHTLSRSWIYLICKDLLRGWEVVARNMMAEWSDVGMKRCIRWWRRTERSICCRWWWRAETIKSGGYPVHATYQYCFCQRRENFSNHNISRIRIDGITQQYQYPWAPFESLRTARSSKMPDILPLPHPTSTTLRSSIILPSLAQIFSELLQNSLDAGATKIECYVNMAKGNESLRVEDNGTGISKDGLAKIGKRFRTSKEIHEGGLGPVGSYGFRGEGK